MKEKAKKIHLQKTALLKLQHEQLNALFGAGVEDSAESITGCSGVACDNPTPPVAVAAAGAADHTCCRRSC
jgi:hypothetical protein